MKAFDKVTFIKSKELIDVESGQVKKEERTTHMMITTEPNYVKLYIDCLLAFQSLSKSLNPVLLEFLKYMSYASMEEEHGGQIIYVNAQMKRNVAEKLKISTKRIDQALANFVSSSIFKRIGLGTYQVNPKMFGKGDWKDIKKIRATFDFNERTVEAEIVKGDENEG